jgi:NADH:ubiquinone oxidoreductase subunit 5 (subunit L)/multisubunit Na+/H+ antiporter MnhA subunit
MSFGAALADNLILFVVFWGILAITLYMLIPAVTKEVLPLQRRRLS